MFDGCGFTVTGIPHILDSVVLTGLSLDDGLLGLHIASFCSGVNDVSFADVNDVSFAWPWAILKVPDPVSITIVAARIMHTAKIFADDALVDMNY